MTPSGQPYTIDKLTMNCCRATDNPRMSQAGSLTTISISAGAGPVSSPQSSSALTEQLSRLSPQGNVPLSPLGTPTHSEQALTAPALQPPAGQHAPIQPSDRQHPLPGSTPPVVQPEPRDISVQMDPADSMQDPSPPVGSAAAAVPPADSAAGMLGSSSAAGGLLPAANLPDPAASSDSDDSTAAAVEGQQWRPTRRKAPSGRYRLHLLQLEACEPPCTHTASVCKLLSMSAYGDHHSTDSCT